MTSWILKACCAGACLLVIVPFLDPLGCPMLISDALRVELPADDDEESADRTLLHIVEVFEREANDRSQAVEKARAIIDSDLDIINNPRSVVEYNDHIDDPEDIELTSEYAVEVNGGQAAADRLARSMGYENLGKVRGFSSVYVFRRNENDDAAQPRRSKREIALHNEKRLSDRSEVLWVEHQRNKRRMKRDYEDVSPAAKMFNDPLWTKEWYLFDARTSTELPKVDLHVIGAWKKGYTGKGVSVTILDDGVQRNHPDLAQNYDPDASYDLNDNDTDPTPTFNDFNKHGTRCAGEVAMVANNSICGVGVAYNAKIGGIRMLDGRITDRLEAEALQYNIDHVDIFSASWGPNDDGKTVEGPGKLASRAIQNGIKKGRGGKGVIYIWASGNGGTYGDNCDCDGYTDSIFTLSIASASQSGKFPWYGEQCASTIATTYSSGAYKDQRITTTDIRGECTTQHSGTSASAPLAAGILALALEANPSLTWRDTQHIAVWTSEPSPLFDNEGWSENGIGLYVSERFGFGLMNAEAFVTHAESWKNVPEQMICKTIFPSFTPRSFDHKHPGVIRFKTDACKDQRNTVRYLEHVQIVVDIEYSRRGNLEIFLKSPSGTIAQLLTTRKRDNSKLGFRSWPFMSVHSWGEDPKGWWELKVSDTVNLNGDDKGKVNNITLITYGTKEEPAHYKKGRKIDMNYNRIRDRAVELKLRRASLAAAANKIESSPISGLLPNSKQFDMSTGLVKNRAAILGYQSRDPIILPYIKENRASDFIDVYEAYISK